MNGEDVFATCSSDGIVDIFSLDSNGRVKARNKAKKGSVQSRPRVASCVSFGREFFWDCLAVGMEGFSDGQNASNQHGMVRYSAKMVALFGFNFLLNCACYISFQVQFYDANTESKKADLEFDRGKNFTTTKSVSCLSFCPSGKWWVIVWSISFIDHCR